MDILKRIKTAFKVQNNDILKSELEAAKEFARLSMSQKKLIIDTIVKRNFFDSVGLKEFKRGVDMAEDVIRPRNYLLIESYKQITDDLHLDGEMEKRLNKITKHKFSVYRNGSFDKAMTKEIDKVWFWTFIEESINAIFWGCSLFEFEFKKSRVNRIELIPRENVIQQRGDIHLDVYLEKGWNYRQKNAFNKRFFEVNTGGLGLLKKAGKAIIRKFYALDDWSIRAEKFGMPFVALFTDQEGEQLNKYEEMFKNLGSNGYSIFGSKETNEIKFLEAQATANAHQIYSELLKYIDEQISKRFVGGTALSNEQAWVGSSELQERMYNDIVDADMRFLETLITHEFFPFLTSWGYELENCEFKFEEESTKKEAKTKDDENNRSEENSFFFELANYYDNLDSCCERTLTLAGDDDFFFDYTTWMGSIELFLQKVNEGKLDATQEPFELFKQTLNAFQKATNIDFMSIDFDTADYVKMTSIRENLFFFSAAKSYSELKEINNLMLENGKMVTYDKFKKSLNIYIEKTKQIDRKYNQHWLRTEFAYAQNVAENTRRWIEFENEVDIFPNLQYKAVKDKRTRPEHERLDGIIKPLDDSFWDTYAPPNGWGCRCYLISTDSDATNIDTKKLPVLGKQFEVNNAKKGVVFKEQHPFFPQKEAERKAMQERSTDYFYKLNAEHNKKIYDDYNKKDFEKVRFDNQTGGFLTKHKAADEYNKQELETINLLIKKGYRVELPEKVKTDFVKSNDLILNDADFDVKHRKAKMRAIKGAFEELKNQATNLILVIDAFDEEAIRRGLGAGIKNNKAVNIVMIKSPKSDSFIILSRKEIETGDYDL